MIIPIFNLYDFHFSILVLKWHFYMLQACLIRSAYHAGVCWDEFLPDLISGKSARTTTTWWQLQLVQRSSDNNNNLVTSTVEDRDFWKSEREGWIASDTKGGTVKTSESERTSNSAVKKWKLKRGEVDILQVWPKNRGEFPLKNRKQTIMDENIRGL